MPPVNVFGVVQRNCDELIEYSNIFYLKYECSTFKRIVLIEFNTNDGSNEWMLTMYSTKKVVDVRHTMNIVHECKNKTDSIQIECTTNRTESMNDIMKNVFDNIHRGTEYVETSNSHESKTKHSYS